MLKHDILSSNITKFRKRSGLTQGELAQRLFVSAQSVSKWETGASQPDLDNLCALSRIFGVSSDELLGLNLYESCGNTLIGIDGGGTKTEFVAFNENGIILKRILLDGSNPNTVGLEKACSILKMGIDSLISDHTVGIFLGIAGCGLERNSSAVTSFLRKHYPDVRLKCTTDIMNVIGSVPAVKDCVAAICGTGSVVYGYSDGELHRVGGWGYLLDRAGSGFDIGSMALRAALAQRDNIGKETLLTHLVEESLGSSVWERIDEIYKKPPSYLASFAPLVFEAVKLHDAVALEILDANTERLTALIKAASKQYSCNSTVVISGSLASRETLLVDALQAKLGNAWKITVPECEQIYGACIQALRLCELDTKPLEEQFKSQYARLTKNA